MAERMKTALSIFIMVLALGTMTPRLSRAGDIVVGVFLPLSGANAVIGHMQENAMLLATEEVNGSGVIPGGGHLKLDVRNGGRRAEDTRNIVNYFIKDKQYPLIISGAGSTAAAEAAGLCQRGLTPLIIITGSADNITRKGFNYIFRIAPPRSHYGDAAVEFAREVIRPASVAIITERSEFGESMMEVVKGTAAKERWKVVYEASINPGRADLDAIASGLAKTEADTVFIAVFPPDAESVIEGIRTAGSEEQTIVSLVPSSVMEDAFQTCGERCRGIFSPALWFDGAQRSADSFKKRYLERYGRLPDYHAAQAYCAVLAAASALSKVDTTNRRAVRDSLKETRIGSPMGMIAFTDWEGYTNQDRPASYLFQWFGDRFEVIWPERYRTAEPIK